MPSVQIRNDQATDIQGADVIRNAYQFFHEPIGDFGIWNGQFQLGSDPYPAEGWQTYSSVGTAYWNRQANGVAGLYCARGGAVAMAVGPTICTLRYMPVETTQNYDITCTARGNTVNSRYSMGALCYDTAKAYLGTTWALANSIPGLAYVRQNRVIGPGGDVNWIANTAYARPCWALQNDATLTNEWIEIDDCHFSFRKPTDIDFIGVRVRRDSNYDLATDTWLCLDYDLENFDTDTMHDLIANPSRITFNRAGVYHVGALSGWESNVNGTRYLQIVLNRTTTIARAFTRPASGESTYHECTTIYEFVKGNYIEARHYQSSGGNLNILTAVDNSPVFWAYKIADPT